MEAGTMQRCRVGAEPASRGRQDTHPAFSTLYDPLSAQCHIWPLLLIKRKELSEPKEQVTTSPVDRPALLSLDFFFSLYHQ